MPEQARDKLLFHSWSSSWLVFNVSQCEGQPERIVNPGPPKVYNKDQRLELADEFIRSLASDLRYGENEAYYAPGLDYINLPRWESFRSADAFYNVSFHEHIHWTENTAMPIRHVIRPPSIRTTPRLLSEALNATTRHSNGRGPFSFRRDFFLIYPHPIRLAERSEALSQSRNLSRGIQSDCESLLEQYTKLHTFYSSSKPAQRAALKSMGVTCPISFTRRYAASAGMAETDECPSGPLRVSPSPSGTDDGLPGRDAANSRERWIVRPLRHAGGRDYRVTEDPTDFIEGEEYIQRVYPKDREYRVIYCYGDPVIVLRKKNNNDIPQDQPWNHANGSFFQTINDVENCKLNRTNFFYVMDTVPIIKLSHLVAVDVMYSNELGYSVCEFNTCPGLTIEANLRKVTTHVSSHCESARTAVA